MSLLSMMPNSVDLYEMTPGKDTSGGSAPTPDLLLQGVSCSVQINDASTMPYYDVVQNRIVVPANVFFNGDALGIEVTADGLLGNYRLNWIDGKGMQFRIKGYGEASLGHSLVWKARCEQVK